MALRDLLLLVCIVPYVIYIVPDMRCCMCIKANDAAKDNKAAQEKVDQLTAQLLLREAEVCESAKRDLSIWQKRPT